MVNWALINDSIHIEGYTPSPSTYAGSQRRGIHQSIVNIASITNHIDQACRMHSRFSEPTPLPKDVRDSINFLHNNNEEEDISKFWGKQIEVFENSLEDN